MKDLVIPVLMFFAWLMLAKIGEIKAVGVAQDEMCQDKDGCQTEPKVNGEGCVIL